VPALFVPCAQVQVVGARYSLFWCMSSEFCSAVADCCGLGGTDSLTVPVPMDEALWKEPERGSSDESSDKSDVSAFSRPVLFAQAVMVFRARTKTGNRLHQRTNEKRDETLDL
jgi:hypothetical protein